MQQHQQNVAKLRQFEQQLRQPPTTDRALSFSEPAPIPPAAAPVPAAIEKAGSAKKNKQDKQGAARPQTKAQ